MLTAAVVWVWGLTAVQWAVGPVQVRAAEPIVTSEPSPVQPAVLSASASTTTTGTATTTTPPTSSTTTSTTSPPVSEDSTVQADYVVPQTEAEPEAKQLAADIAYSLTTYEASDHNSEHLERLEALGSRSSVQVLGQASEPLTHPGSWSRGEVIYPQLGGLENGLASVMVVTRQTVGTGSEADFSVVRTLDIRLVHDESGWEFDYLSSAGGTFENLDALATADVVASDPRIQMPDTARLDILAGLVSPNLLEVMAELADQTPYEVVVLATGHPHNVFETNRVSQHTVGQAVDVYRIGDHQVIDDRGPDGATKGIVEWLYDHPDVAQVGSPWDLDGAGSGRSFTNVVHQDHIHLAVK